MHTERQREKDIDREARIKTKRERLFEREREGKLGQPEIVGERVTRNKFRYNMFPRSLRSQE